MRQSLPLLSIAIPTWNRAAFLENALAALLPQVNEVKDKVEFIISDNASTDYTQDVVNEFRLKFPDISFCTFIQQTNTGFYGNFRKCREMASGEYFWLLSDNDYLVNGTLKEVISILTENRGIGLVFLKKWVESIPKEIKHCHSEIIDFNALFTREKYYPTLISASVILNVKNEDDYLFTKYDRNSFLGFILLLKAGKSSPRAIILDGPSLQIDKGAEIKWNVLKAWIEDMGECLDYMKQCGYIDMDVTDCLTNVIIRETVKSYYLMYKTKGKAFGAGNISMGELNNRIFKVYKKHKSYWISLLPFIIFPPGLLNFYIHNPGFKNFKKKLRKLAV